MALMDLLRAGGEYYLGQENIEGAQQLGRETQAGMEQLGTQLQEQAQFKPYTVTSGLANVRTTPEGGFGIDLSSEQQALQTQLQGQVGGLFGQVGADPATAQAQLYEQMRAVQRPEEERQRLALEERMLSQGRLGLGSAAYGGSSPELLAQETARQEAMARANLGARQQSQAEMLQAGQLGGLLQAAGYQPQQQALSMLEASQIPSQLQQKGQLGGVELRGQLGQTGLEARLQAEDLANRLQQQQQQGLMTSLLGKQPTMQEQLMNRILGGANAAPLTDSGGVVGSLLSYLTNGRESTQNMLTVPTGATDSFLGGSNFLSSIFLPEVTNPYDTGSLFSNFVPTAIPSAGQSINLGNIQAPDDFGYQPSLLPRI